MISEFSLDCAFWDSILKESDYDFYHLYDYFKIESSSINGEPISFLYENGKSRALIPLIKRKTSTHGRHSEFYDLVSAYGYSGILINREFDYRNYNHLVSEFCKESERSNIVSAFVRLNPIINNYLFSESEYIIQEIHGKTIYVDLTEEYQDIYSSYSSNHKRNIKKLHKQGFEVVFNDWSRYEEWQNLYIETMQRLNASQYYFFNKEYFNLLKKSLDNRLILVLVLYNGAVAAGGLFTSYNGIIQYHLGGTKEEFLSLAPTKLMFDSMIKWGIENGCKVLHLGGGLGASSDSLFMFKYGFSKKTFRFSTLRCITNPSVYSELVKAAFPGSENNIDLNSINFFPLYRYKI